MPLQEEMEKQGNWLFKYRSILPISVLLIGVGIFIYTEIHPSSFFLEDTPYEIYYEMGCLIVGLLGLFIRIYTVGHTPANTSGRNTNQGQVADMLNTTGIYSIVRHPLYVGNFFMWLALALLTGNFWFVLAFCLFYWIYYERIMFAEEQFLRKKFGDVYLQWASKTPAFIPNFKLFIKPNLPFSWKKMLKKEKNGLVALLFLFCAFNVLAALIDALLKRAWDINYTLVVATGMAVILYLVLKYLKNKTSALNEKDR